MFDGVKTLIAARLECRDTARDVHAAQAIATGFMRAGSENILEVDMEDMRCQFTDSLDGIEAMSGIPAGINSCAECAVSPVPDMLKHFSRALFWMIFNTQTQPMLFQNSNGCRA